MSRRKSRTKGQGLVEYALILVLVAVVAIVILNLFGRGAQRIFGIVTASLGTKVEAKDLEIGYAECAVLHSENKTTIWVRGYTQFKPQQLSGSTDRNFDGEIAQSGYYDGEDPKKLNRSSGGVDTFQYTGTIANKADGSVCPTVVVIQSESGALAAWPIKLVER